MEEILKEEWTEATASVFTFRNLKVTDIGPACKIVSKLGLNDIARVFGKDNAFQLIKEMKEKDNNKDVDPRELGIELAIQIADVLLNNVQSVQVDLINFMASMVNLDFETLNNDPSLFLDIFMEFFKRPDLVGFCKTASKYMSKLDLSHL